MMRRAAFLVCALAGFWQPGAQATPAGGWESALWRVRGASLRLPAYGNDGYQQEVLPDGRILVRVDAGPMEVEATAAPQHLPQSVAAVFGVQPGLDATAPDRAGDLRESLSFLRGPLVEACDAALRLAGAAWPEKPEACVERARLAVALLRELGVPARTVSGILADPSRPFTLLEGARLHRWVELWLPGRGWLFADPGRFHFFLPPRYLFLGFEGALPEGTVSELAGRKLELLTTAGRLALRPDAAPRASIGEEPWVRWNRAGDLATLLLCRLERGGGGEIRLSALDGSLRRAARASRGWAAFAGLPRGVYTLESGAGRTLVSVRGEAVEEVVIP